jgi:alpha-L-rhamnosidase
MNDYIWEKAYYGDWLNIDGETDADVLATATQAVSVRMIADMFNAVGYDSAKYYEIYENIKKAFRNAFVGKDGKIKSNSQASYAIAYYGGLIDEWEATNNLYATLEEKNFHIHSGFVGIRFILPVLCDLGMKDVAYRLITNETYPSWGYSIVNGATTVWERWNSYTKQDGFADRTMNSFNHYALGSCGEWYYEYMLGIKPASPGFERVQIKPYVDRTGKITSAKGHYDSRNGRIAVEWSVKNGVAEICVEKPETMPAEFCFENVLSIEQDGKKEQSFRENAKVTKVKISL